MKIEDKAWAVIDKKSRIASLLESPGELEDGALTIYDTRKAARAAKSSWEQVVRATITYEVK